MLETAPSVALTWINLDSGLGSSLLPGGGAGDVTDGGHACGGYGGGGALDEGLVLIRQCLLDAADAPPPDVGQ